MLPNEKINESFKGKKNRFRQNLFLKRASARGMDEKNKNITQNANKNKNFNDSH